MVRCADTLWVNEHWFCCHAQGEHEVHWYLHDMFDDDRQQFAVTWRSAPQVIDADPPGWLDTRPLCLTPPAPTTSAPPTPTEPNEGQGDRTPSTA